ncbi:uncharacterized protein LOC117107442 isoform X2 [Anneissia japonica]|uniref:uncharacterized protein LOC117107442 isoform X2 n=1 Tax=Anneissia japonica TaxID=1529436 RepID=UPI0014256AE9|nr:uncharacterized protein LOC117107442 isoform X2 [Anneissia japonica]
MTEPLIKKLEDSLSALRNNLKKFKDIERCLQESKEVMLKEKMLEVDVASSVSTARNQLSENSKKVFDQAYPLLQEIYKQKLLVLELDEQTFIQKAHIEKKRILKKKHQHQIVKTDDAPTNTLVKWWTEMQMKENDADVDGMAIHFTVA